MLSFLLNPFFILPILLVGWAQMRVRSAFKKYSQMGSASRLSGAETARRILQQQGIYDVSVEETGGMLSDHYDPRARAVRLSSDNFHGDHLAGLAVAAHEVGHAIQHAHGYAPLNLRSAILPVANLGSTLGFPLILAGMFFTSIPVLMDIGIMLFAGAVLFQIVTLPVEFNASSRAMAILSQGYLASDEVRSARKVLNAAAMTYVATAATAVLQLAMLLMRGSDE